MLPDGESIAKYRPMELEHGRLVLLLNLKAVHAPKDAPVVVVIVEQTQEHKRQLDRSQEHVTNGQDLALLDLA